MMNQTLCVGSPTVRAINATHKHHIYMHQTLFSHVTRARTRQNETVAKSVRNTIPYKLKKRGKMYAARSSERLGQRCIVN